MNSLPFPLPSAPPEHHGGPVTAPVNPGDTVPPRGSHSAGGILSHGPPLWFRVWQPMNEMLTISGSHRPSGAAEQGGGRTDSLPGTAPAHSGNSAPEIARRWLGGTLWGGDVGRDWPARDRALKLPLHSPTPAGALGLDRPGCLWKNRPGGGNWESGFRAPKMALPHI